MRPEELLDEVHGTLRQARALLGASAAGISRDASLLGIYEELRERLQKVDGDRMREALGQIAETVERLGGLSEEIERLRTVRRAIKKND